MIGFRIILLSWLGLVALAQQEKSAFEKSLERDTGVNTEESWVEINGERLRKIEFNRGRYYVSFRKHNSKLADVYCEPPKGAVDEHLVDSPVQTYRRTAAFVQAFHESCSKVSG